MIRNFALSRLGLALLAIFLVASAFFYEKGMRISTALPAQAASVSCVDLRSNLSVGARGIAISQLQQFLGVQASGYFGVLTKKAVKSWQSAHGISATGYVGPATRAAMRCGAATSANTIPTSTVPPVSTAAAAGEAAGLYGLGDPSQADVPGQSGEVYRAVSVIDPSGYCANLSTCGSQNKFLESTNLYVSYQGGAPNSWKLLGTLNLGRDLGNGTSEVHEVPSIVYDPSDGVDTQWKVIWDHYIGKNGARDNTMAWLAMKEAPSPGGPAVFGPEVKLMAGSSYDPDNSVNPGRPIFYPLPSKLSDCSFISEPAALGTTDGFYLAFECGGASFGKKIPLVKIRRAAGQWTMEQHGTLLTVDDAKKFAAFYGSQYSALSHTGVFNEPDLFSIGSQVYLIATPGDVVKNVNAGCVVFQVSDLNTGQLVRNADGSPKMLKYVPSADGGACTYSSHSTGSGIVLASSPVFSSPDGGRTVSVTFSVVNTLAQFP